MSIQRMPYPPYVKIDEADTLLREAISTFAAITFVIPLCIEASYASKEKFIGINVSTVLFLFTFPFLITEGYLSVLFSGLNGNEWSPINL